MVVDYFKSSLIEENTDERFVLTLCFLILYSLSLIL